MGTNTGPLPLSDGSIMPATGRAVRVRGCDIATVVGGVIVRHHFYFDQMELLTQLGLAPKAAVAAGSVPPTGAGPRMRMEKP